VAVIVEDYGIVQVHRAVVAIQLEGLFEGSARVIKITQLIQGDREVHVAVGEVRLQADGGLEVLESRYVLFCVHVDKTKVEGGDPLEGV
jgi:hypothetical protein